MNHLSQIAAQLSNYDLDAMLITSEPGEFYALGFHGEGLLIVTPDTVHYSTDGRYIEAAHAEVKDFEILMPDRSMLTEIADLIGDSTLADLKNSFKVL